LAGGDALDAGDLATIFPWGRRASSKWMTPELAGDLRTWLVEPDHAAAQRAPLSLNSRQRELATTRTTTGYRRIRGPAGCGKSLSLAARAAHLSAEGKQVLVVLYNLTLLHFLRDLAVRYPEPRKSITSRITWLHFHSWCKRVCQEAGMEEEYRQLWRDRTGAQTDGDGDDEPPTSLLERDLPELVGRAISAAGDDVSRYDAILVDEGQDYHLEWWNLLRRVLRPGGEMVLTADTAQDLYTRASRWTDGSLENAGFRGGNWFRLEGSHRFPPDFVPHLRRFAEQHVPGKDIDLPTAVQGELFESVQLQWLQVPASSIVEECVRAAYDLTQAAAPAIPWADITLLVRSHKFGLQCVEAFNARGVEVAHVFGLDHKERKRRKLGFWMGDSRM
jgi:superfamily I DNA/RNA helicase